MYIVKISNISQKMGLRLFTDQKKPKQNKKNSAFGYKGARFEFQFCYLLTRANFLTFLKDCIKNN